MKAGSLKTLAIGELSEPDQVVQVLEELPHCTHLSELKLNLFQSDKVRHTHQCYNGCLFHTVMCLWYFVSHDMHVTPSSLQVVTLPSAVGAGLSKCTTLQKLTVRGSPPCVTAALLKAVTVIRSLEEVTLDLCDYGM